MPDWPPLGPRQTWGDAGEGPGGGRWINGVWQPPAWSDGGLAPRPDDRRRETGAAGEDRAARFLEKLGYRIVERNWRNDFGELDIVAMDGKQLVLVEVRTLASPHYTFPEESVGARKRRQLANLAAAYVQHVKHDGEWRVDVVAIDRDGLRHIKNAVSLW